MRCSSACRLPRQESAPRLESSPTPFLTHPHATGTKNDTGTPSWKSREATECIARRGGPPQQWLPPAPLERVLGTRGRLRATLSKRHTVKALPRPREPRAHGVMKHPVPFTGDSALPLVSEFLRSLSKPLPTGTVSHCSPLASSQVCSIRNKGLISIADSLVLCCSRPTQSARQAGAGTAVSSPSEHPVPKRVASDDIHGVTYLYLSHLSMLVP